MQTKKRKKRIIIFIIVFFILGLIALFFLLKPEQKTKLTGKTKNLFPFGEINPGKQQQIKQEEEQTEQEVKEIQKEQRKAGPRLRQISDFPTGGFIPLIHTEDKEVSDITINADGTKIESKKTIQVKNNAVRYSSIKDGTIYESHVDPYEIHQNLLVENYIPNVEMAYFSKSGNHVAFQYWNREENVPETYLETISKIPLKIEKCPYDFSKPIKVGDDNKNVLDLHEFLNKNPLTQIAKEGTNSPGNESSLAVPATITAIKNFQSLYNLDIDGKLGPTTQKMMTTICDALQKKKAEEEYKKLKRKYKTSGSFLPQNITSITMSPVDEEMFYILKDKKGSVGIKKPLTDEENKGKTIFESTYSDWLAFWNSVKNIELTARASYLSDGYSYRMNPENGDFHKSLHQEKGMTVLASPNNRSLFVHAVQNNIIHNFIYTRRNQLRREINIQTFPEKCVWTKDSKGLYCLVPNNLKNKGKYPDIWYQGMESFVDSLYHIDGRTGKVDLVSDFPSEYGKQLDISKIGIDDNGDYLYFIDKNTEYLWSYRLLNVE